jgi:hypothetical protein
MEQEEFAEIIEALKGDIRFYNDMIKEVAVDIIAEGFSRYPIFIATEHEVKIGNIVFDKKDYARDFTIYATTMEELVEKKLILEQKKEEFVKTFKDPRKFICILLITSETASFVFLPYRKRQKEEDDE